MRVAVIIPARNESEALGCVLSELPTEAGTPHGLLRVAKQTEACGVADGSAERRSRRPRALIQEVLVVDNGSTDGTADVARRHGARVVTEPIPGYGRACLAGIAALAPAVDVVVFMDADHSDYPEELPSVLAPIADGRADLVIGSRTAQAQAGSLTLQQRFGNRLACALMRRCFGIRYTDLGPFRAIRREALARLQMRDRAFGWTVEMQAKAARLKLRVVEVPVRYRPRIGRSKISGTLRGTVLAGAAILSTIAKIALSNHQAPNSNHQRLLIFLKEPRPGQVKTRLAAAIGDGAACAAYRACVERTLAQVGGARASTVLYVDPPEAAGAIRAWLGADRTVRPQQGRTLGDRLAQAAREAFADGAARVILMGTDSPWLTARELDGAFAALKRHDVVLGPTEDGGYYLIGMSRALPALFEGIAWSTASVYAETLARARALGLRAQTLRRGYDIDRVDDLTRFLSSDKGVSCLS